VLRANSPNCRSDTSGTFEGTADRLILNGVAIYSSTRYLPKTTVYTAALFIQLRLFFLGR
jgi:hypothetical protein